MTFDFFESIDEDLQNYELDGPFPTLFDEFGNSTSSFSHPNFIP